MSHATPAGPRAPITIFPARKVITMDESLPEATAIAVSEGRIVAVGDMDSMAPWREGRTVTVDARLEKKVLLPGLIDNHVHPWLGALLQPAAIIAPEAWRNADGSEIPAALDRDAWFRRLREEVAARRGNAELIACWGFHQAWHGRNPRRAELDEICPDRPLMVWNRSYHEIFANTKALAFAGLTREAAHHPQINWDEGHFFELGSKTLLHKLLPWFMRRAWFHEGLSRVASLMHRGGLTTVCDMGFGSLGIDYEIAAWDEVVAKPGRPLRVYNVPHVGALGYRLAGRAPNPFENPGFERVLELLQGLPARDTASMKTLRAVKLFADGGFFNLMMRLGAPGYTDGRTGQWMMSPEVIADGIRTFWDAGYQIHVHVNGDEGMDAVLSGLQAAQARAPRFDHRFAVHHVGFCTAAQVRRLGALGAVASVNPYHIHALTDSYSIFGLGRERASQMVRLGSMRRAGMPVSFHSDFMMAPTEPLFLAWCAATRRSVSGQVLAPAECLSLEDALRGVTIDAAHAIGLDHEIGSLVAGKRADFTVLEDDPFSKGAIGLKDLKIWGTVFEGGVFPLAAPSASLHRAARPRRRPTAPHGMRSVARADCCSIADDRCDTAYRLASWVSDALPARS